MPGETHPHAALAEPSSIRSMPGTPQRFIGAVKDEWQLYSDQACDYTIGEPIGFGASSIVYAAQWKPVDDPNASPVPCALKVLDLDSLPPRSLQLLQRETTLMSLSKHPNVLRVRGSWIEGHKLYIALRLMNKGSAADVMRYGWQGGMEEEVVKCILRQALKGLNYLHINGFIHRDIKAANLLIDDDGTVLLGDLGVAADLAEDPHHHQSSMSSKSKNSSITATAVLSQSQPSSASTRSSENKGIVYRGAEHVPVSRPKMGKRKSFVGTPCWMAPELILGKQYDASADIWSFGITALELSQGRPPRFRESPQKVLLRTLQEEPPTLDRDGGTHKYTRAFKDMVDSCLLKDPSKRPTAEQLLQSPFFRSAKKKSYLVNAILKGLPPLTQRQERRPLPSAQSPNSIDSWDFSTTVNSPTSLYRRRALEELVAAEDRDAAAAIFEMDGDLTPSTTTRLDHAALSSPEHEEFNYQVQDHSSDIVSSSPATTDSQISRSVTRTSTADASTPDLSTAPSSYADPSPLSPKTREIRPSTSHSIHRIEEPASSQNSSLPSHSTAPALAAAVSSPTKKITSATSDPDVRKRSHLKGKVRDSSPHGLWRKLKSNLKRPSSPSPAQDADVDSPSHGSLEKGGKLASIFASASKNTIGQSSKSGTGKRA